MAPVRILDTRDGTGSGGVNPLGANSTIDLTVTGVAGVPARRDRGGPQRDGHQRHRVSYLTVWPAGPARPQASNINFYPGWSAPNLVMARVGVDGKVSMYNNFGAVNVVADVQGGTPTRRQPAPVRAAQPGPHPGHPQRHRRPDGEDRPRRHDSAEDDGVGGVPTENVAAVVLNVTATNVSSAESYLTLLPSGGSARWRRT